MAGLPTVLRIAAVLAALGTGRREPVALLPDNSHKHLPRESGVGGAVWDHEAAGIMLRRGGR